MRNLFQRLLVIAVAAALLRTAGVARADTLTWRTNENLVSAELSGVPLMRVLEGVAKATGWRVYLESNTTFNVSTKFTDLHPGEALRHMLGDLNFALGPPTNAPRRLYVFRSSQQNATLLIRPGGDLNSAGARAKAIPNELIVRLKPGANIDDLARRLGAKVTGRIDGVNAYRLQFPDAAAAEDARDKLGENSDVTGIESNFMIDPPPP